MPEPRWPAIVFESLIPEKLVERRVLLVVGCLEREAGARVWRHARRSRRCGPCEDAAAERCRRERQRMTAETARAGDTDGTVNRDAHRSPSSRELDAAGGERRAVSSAYSIDAENFLRQ
jgi:hypothetical protein